VTSSTDPATSAGPTTSAVPRRQPSLPFVWTVAGLVVTGWGLNFVFAKEALDQVDVGPFNFVRFGGMVLLGWVVVLAGGRPTPVRPQDRRRLVIVAVVGFCGYVFGFSVGLSLTSAFSASLLLAMVPLFVVIFTAVVERRAPTIGTVAALVLAIVGSVVFVTARTSVEVGWGDVITVGVAACYGGYLMLNRALVDHYSPFTLTTYASTLAAIPILAATAPTLAGQDWGAVDATGWAAMAWVIIGPVFVAWSVWNWVLRHLSAQQVAPLLFTVPVISGCAAWLLLDEAIVAGQIVGAGLVVVGLVVNQRTA